MFFLLSAHALQLLLSPAEICRSADQVAVVTIRSIDTARVGDTIERVVTARVDRALKNVDREVLLITLRGGKVDEDIVWVEDQPNLLKGATYLVSLDARGRVFGGSQGAVRITPAGSSIGQPLQKALSALEGCDAK